MWLRFKQFLSEMGLADVTLNGKPLDPGSLRPGGATWILQQTEDSEFTCRRGRWVNQEVMELYIQEVFAFQFLSAIPTAKLNKVLQLCNIFPEILKGATQLWHADIPSNVWYHLWIGKATR